MFGGYGRLQLTGADVACGCLLFHAGLAETVCSLKIMTRLDMIMAGMIYNYRQIDC